MNSRQVQIRILVAEDDPGLNQILAIRLRRAGYEVVTVADGEAAMKEWQRVSPQLMVLDWNLPGRTGLEILESVRQVSTIPIILLTVKNSEEDILRAYEAGADDFVTKPFSPQQLIARMQAALRRAGIQDRPEIELGGVRLDLLNRQVTVAGKMAEPSSLSPLEARLLEVLMSAPNQPMATERLIERVWGYEPHMTDFAMLKGLVRRLRLKLEPQPSNPHYLKTVPAVGYVFAVDGAPENERPAKG